MRTTTHHPSATPALVPSRHRGASVLRGYGAGLDDPADPCAMRSVARAQSMPPIQQLQMRTGPVRTSGSRRSTRPMPASFAERVVLGFDRAPVLAARALPMVRAGAEAAASATISRRPHQQLIADLL